jgi:hypothetical protein
VGLLIFNRSDNGLIDKPKRLTRKILENSAVLDGSLEYMFLTEILFQFAIQKYKDEDIQNYNFACCFVWV